MALNPIVFTERVVRSFLRYQLTAYPFADERLHAQMRRLLSLDETRQSPLLKGPYLSLSRPFRQGAAVDALVREGGGDNVNDMRANRFTPHLNPPPSRGRRSYLSASGRQTSESLALQARVVQFAIFTPGLATSRRPPRSTRLRQRCPPGPRSVGGRPARGAKCRGQTPGRRTRSSASSPAWSAAGRW